MDGIQDERIDVIVVRSFGGGDDIGSVGCLAGARVGVDDGI